MTEVEIAVKAVQIYAETHPRPSQVTQDQAAERKQDEQVRIVRRTYAGLAG